jgi:hypothetical protein
VVPVAFDDRVRCGAQLGDVRLDDATRHYFAW